MAKTIALLLCVFLLKGFSINAQQHNYVQYHKRFAVIEALIVAEKFAEAETELNDLFENFYLAWSSHSILLP